MICLLAIKETVAPPLILLPLPFLTLAYAYAAHTTFYPPMQTLSLLVAADRDATEAAQAVEGKASDADAYVSPSLRVSEMEHVALLAQCGAAREAQATGAYAALSAMFDPEGEDSLPDDTEADADADDHLGGAGAGKQQKVAVARAELPTSTVVAAPQGPDTPPQAA